MAFGRFAVPLTVCVIALGAGLSHAQANLQSFDRQLEQINRETKIEADYAVPAGQRALIDYGAYLNFQFFSIDDASHDTHVLRQYDLTAYMRINIDDVHEFFFRASADYDDFNPHDSFDGKGDDFIGPSLDRASYKFDLQNYLNRYEGKNVNYDLSVEVGRQLVNWGNGLTLNEEIDGGVITGKLYPFSVVLLAGVTADKALDFDTYRVSDGPTAHAANVKNPDFDFSDRTHRDFLGVMGSWQVLPKHSIYAYFLIQDDQNPDDARVDTLAGTTVATHFRYNSDYAGFGAKGELIDRLLYGAEVVYEGGQSLSSSFTGDINTAITPVTQQMDPIQAAAADFRLDYLFTDPNQTRLGGEVVLASGDNNRVRYSNSSFGGNTPGTADHGFNAFGLINTGLAFNPEVSNLFMVRLGASTTPFPGVSFVRKLQVGADAFLFNKLSADAPINEDTVHDGYLGFETDLYANWQIVSDVSLSVRYGIFFPGEALTHFPGNNNDPRNFFFTGLSFAF